MKTVSDLMGHDELSHSRVVEDIATARFGLDDWSVTTFPTEVPASSELQVLPHILATHDDDIVAMGTVEMNNICAERALKWKALGESCVRYYLFVPDIEVENACQLIAEHSIPCAGLRSYKYNGKLEISTVQMDEVCCRDDDHPWWVSLGNGD